MRNEREKQYSVIEISGKQIHDFRSKEAEGGLYTPTDFLVLQTTDCIVMTNIAFCGEREKEFYPIQLIGAVEKSLRLLGNCEDKIEFSLYSAFSGAAFSEPKDNGLGIKYDCTPIMFSVKKFKELHGGMSPNIFIPSKSCLD